MHRRCCRPAASSVHCTTSCKHSLMFLRMGEIIARNRLSWLKPLLLHLVGYLYYWQMGFNSVFKGLRVTGRDIIIHLHGTSRTESCRILMKHEFSEQIPEKSRISNFMKILQMGAELVQSNRRTEKTNLVVAFGNFAKASKIIHHIFMTYFIVIIIIIILPLLSSSPKMYLSIWFP